MPKYYLQADPGILMILARHGSTPDNDSATCCVRGWKDELLSPRGEIEAQQLAERVRPYNVKAIFSSDFMRDTSTAEIIGKRLGIPTEQDFNARTWDVGQFSGKPEAEVMPAIAALYRRSWEKPPGSSESFDDFTDRWNDFLERKMQLATIDAFRPVMIVTHGRNIAVTDAFYEGLLVEDAFMPKPAGFATISIGLDRGLVFQIQGPKERVSVDK